MANCTVARSFSRLLLASGRSRHPAVVAATPFLRHFSATASAVQPSIRSGVVSESYKKRTNTSNLQSSAAEAQQDVCAPSIENRNPRNLEQLGLARKQLGWQLHHPRKDYWHKLNFVRTNRNTSANVLHCSGDVVLSASTNEAAVRRHLESATDVSAASLIGAVLAERCLAAGITCVHFNNDEYEDPAQSKRLTAFLNEFKENGIALEEPPSRAHEIEDDLLGVDYDTKEEAELAQNQEAAARRLHVAQIAESLQKRAHSAASPVNLKVLPDGRALSSQTGELISPKVPSADDLARAAEEERRRRSVYVVTPPNQNQKPKPANLVFAE